MNPKVEKLKYEALGLGTGDNDRLNSLLAKNTPMHVDIGNPRLINSYAIGCDPEFMMADVRTGLEINSDGFEALGLGTAYGRDGSGRPVELRAHPSRFALEVVASLLNTMRFMVLHIPNTARDISWHSGPVFGGNALGGHIHFGKKYQGERQFEVQALQKVANLLDMAGVFPEEAQARRRKIGYGGTFDYREQGHGWEFRVLPSWLQSPGLAHLALTLAKITLKDWRIWGLSRFSDKNGKEYVRDILAGYRFLDDDCAVALSGLKHTLDEENLKGDIKVRWGISVPSSNPVNASQPKSVPPDTKAIEETFSAITEGVPPTFRVPEVTWKGEKEEEITWISTPPNGFNNFIKEKWRDRHLAPIFHHTVSLADWDFIYKGATYRFLQVPILIYLCWSKEETVKLRKLLKASGCNSIVLDDQIKVPDYWFNGDYVKIPAIKRVFEENLLPICPVSLATPKFRAEWTLKLNKAQKLLNSMKMR